MFDPARGTPLSDDVLRRRSELPLKPAPVTLTGSIVQLRPLDLARDVPTLYAISNGQPATLGEREVDAYDADALIWRYMSGGPFADAAALAAWLRAQVEAPNVLCSRGRRARHWPADRGCELHEQRAGPPQDRAWEHLVQPARAADRRQHRGDLPDAAPRLRAGLPPRRVEVRRPQRALAPGRPADGLQVRGDPGRPTTSSRAATATPPGSGCSTTSGRPPASTWSTSSRLAPLPR